MRGQSRAAAVSVLALAACAMAGCGAAPGKQSTTAASGPSASAAPAIRCGQTRTAAGVPVDVEIVGQVSCHDAMTCERDYSRALA